MQRCNYRQSQSSKSVYTIELVSYVFCQNRNRISPIFIGGKIVLGVGEKVPDALFQIHLLLDMYTNKSFVTKIETHERLNENEVVFKPHTHCAYLV